MARDPLIVARIPVELDTAVRDYAGQHGLAVSAVLRDALRDYLPTTTPHPAPQPRIPARTRTTAVACKHRVRPGNYCRRCDALVP